MRNYRYVTLPQSDSNQDPRSLRMSGCTCCKVSDPEQDRLTENIEGIVTTQPQSTNGDLIMQLKKQLSDKDKQISDLSNVAVKLRSGIKDYQKKNDELSDENGKLHQEREQNARHHQEEDARYKQKIAELSSRLSKEMESKVAANESDLENVSVKNRPLNIAEDYQMWMSEEWYEAKSKLDDVTDAPEWQKLNLLNQAIKACENGPSDLYQTFQTYQKHILLHPTALLKPDTLDIENIDVSIEGDESKELPKSLSNATGDFLRREADTVELAELQKIVWDKFDGQMKTSELYSPMWKKVSTLEALQKYTSSMVRIGWKMALQRPPMVFKHSTSFEGENVHERYWGSSESPEAKTIQVYPTLYHAGKVLAKGKMYSYLSEDHGTKM